MIVFAPVKGKYVPAGHAAHVAKQQKKTLQEFRLMLTILLPVVASKLTSYCPEGQLLMHTGEAGDCQVVAIKINGAEHGKSIYRVQAPRTISTSNARTRRITDSVERKREVR